MSIPDIFNSSKLPLLLSFRPLLQLFNPSSIRFLALRKLSVAWLAARNDILALRVPWLPLDDDVSLPSRLVSTELGQSLAESSSWSDLVGFFQAEKLQLHFLRLNYVANLCPSDWSVDIKSVWRFIEEGECTPIIDLVFSNPNVCSDLICESCL